MTASGTAGANQASLATLSRNNTLTSCEDVSSFIALAFAFWCSLGFGLAVLKHCFSAEHGFSAARMQFGHS